MTSKDSTINVEIKGDKMKQNDKIAFNILRIYITIYHTYQLLYCKGYNQMRNNNRTINVETKKKPIE